MSLTMHSFHHEPTGVVIHHNGDLSGPVKIVIPLSLLDGRELADLVYVENDVVWIDDLVPAAAIGDFSLSAVLSKVISTVENITSTTD